MAFEGLIPVLLVIFLMLRFWLAAMEKKKKTGDAAKSGTVTPAQTRAKKRPVMANAELWRAAKRQQDDAEQLHSIRMDTCESRLESLRILYNAGILDREEYAQRVERTKARHAHAGEK